MNKHAVREQGAVQLYLNPRCVQDSQEVRRLLAIDFVGRRLRAGSCQYCAVAWLYAYALYAICRLGRADERGRCVLQGRSWAFWSGQL